MNMTEKTKKLKVADIRPYSNNSKLHSSEQIERLAKSIKDFGYLQKIGVDKNNEVVFGHCRLLAIKHLKYDGEIEVVDLSYLKPKEIKKLRILDNKVVSEEWDLTMLQTEIQSIYSGEADMEIMSDELGIDLRELGDILPESETEGDDDVPEDVETITKPGDLWELGQHKVLCGDSTQEGEVNFLMGGDKADMVFTDPPYGMDAVKNSGVLKKSGYKDIIGDDSTNTAKKAFELCKKIKYKVFWGANYYPEVLPPSGCWIIWDKNNGGSDQADAELAWTNFNGVVRKFEKSSEKINRVHPTQKPIGLIQWCFGKWEFKDLLVLDLFLGSGSTLIACEKTNRRCYGMEIDEHYCDVIRDRYIKWCQDNDRTPEVKLNGNPWKITGKEQERHG